VNGCSDPGHTLALPITTKIIMITCQHEWVEQCQLRYRCEPPSGYHFENAHYPLSERQGETNTLPLWYPDHIVHGVLQTLDTRYPCIHTPKYKQEIKILEKIYPEYLDLYWEAYRFCKKYASDRALEVKTKDGKPLGSYKGGLVSGRNHAINRTGVCGRSAEKIKEDGRKGGSISGPLNHRNQVGIHSPEWSLVRPEVSRRVAARLVSEKLGIHSEEWLNSEECLENRKRNGKKVANEGIGIHTFESRSAAGKKGSRSTNNQKWIDPDHPELGEHSAATLTQMQKRRGYPHGKENRKRVG